jgi:protein-disulfide isomerase
MAFVLKHVCLLCLSLDVIVVSWLVTVLPLALRVGENAPKNRLTTPMAARVAGFVAAAIALLGGTVSAVYTPPPVSTAAELETREPEFVSHYRGRPVVAMDSVLRPDAATKGRADAPVTIVEFSDFQCPACGQAFRDLHELLASRTDVRLVFRNFPLDSSCNEALPRPIHPDACNAAIAAECARRQGRFWEYHDLLFENQRTLDRDSLFRYARDVGLDVAAFRTCLDDPATRVRISDDARAGIAAGVESTPTLFINGRRIDGALERAYYDYALVLEQDKPAHP